MDYIYIVLSRSKTTFARAIQNFTKKYYNHTSISFREDLSPFYSFGRRYPRFVVPAGFITEGVNEGFFRVNPSTEICVIKVPVEDKAQFLSIKKKLMPFLANPKRYKYNIKKIPLMMAGIPNKNKKKFVCSAFVAYLLNDILDYGKDYSLVYPEDFLNFGFEILYEGTAENYGKHHL